MEKKLSEINARQCDASVTESGGAVSDKQEGDLMSSDNDRSFWSNTKNEKAE
jgi:hypothetical protein